MELQQRPHEMFLLFRNYDVLDQKVWAVALCRELQPSLARRYRRGYKGSPCAFRAHKGPGKPPSTGLAYPVLSSRAPATCLELCVPQPFA